MFLQCSVITAEHNFREALCTDMADYIPSSCGAGSAAHFASRIPSGVRTVVQFASCAAPGATCLSPRQNRRSKNRRSENRPLSLSQIRFAAPASVAHCPAVHCPAVPALFAPASAASASVQVTPAQSCFESTQPDSVVSRHLSAAAASSATVRRSVLCVLPGGLATPP